jgi:hypothetical protein
MRVALIAKQLQIQRKNTEQMAWSAVGSQQSAAA